MTFVGACGCPIGNGGRGSPACRLSGPLAATWCSGLTSERMRRERAGGGTTASWFADWAAVKPGDLVRAGGAAGGDTSWWQVVSWDGWRVQLVGPGGLVLWGKIAPTPWEVAHGWVALDPASRVELLPARETMGDHHGAAGELTFEQAAEVIRWALGGREIT